MFLYDFWNAPFGVRVEHTPPALRRGGRAGDDRPDGLVPRRRAPAVDEGARACVALLGGDRPGGARRDSGSRRISTTLAAVHGVHRAGVLRPDGRPLRPDRPRLARRRPAPAPTRRSCGAASAVMLALVYGQVVVGRLAPALRRRPPRWSVHAVLGRGRLGPRRRCSPGGSRGGRPRSRRSGPSARAIGAARDAPGRPRGRAPGGCSGRSTATPGRVDALAGDDPDRPPGQRRAAAGLGGRADPAGVPAPRPGVPEPAGRRRPSRLAPDLEAVA